MTTEDLIPDSIDTSEPAPDYVGREEGLAMIREFAREIRREELGLPAAASQPPHAEPVTSEQQNRARAEAALARSEEKARLDVLAKALLAEERGYDDSELDAMTREERLIEAGLDYSGERPEQRKARELREYDARVLSDPAFAEQEETRIDLQNLRTQWFNLPDAVRESEAERLGLDPKELQRDAWETWSARTGIPLTGKEK